MMKRLTEVVNYLPLKLKWVRDAEVISKLAEYEDTELEPNEIEKMKHKLADYEDDEEEGRLIVFPVAVGDHVWQVKPMPYDGLNELTVTSLSKDANGGLFAHGKEMETGYDHYFTLSHLGDFIFTDKAEAEAKVKEIKNNQSEEKRMEIGTCNNCDHVKKTSSYLCNLFRAPVQPNDFCKDWNEPSHKTSMQEQIERIADSYEFNHQSVKLFEEIGELMQALAKLMLDNGPESEYKADLPNVKEELADVLIVLLQIKYLLDISDKDLEAIIESKIERQLARIQEEQKNN